MSNPMNVASFLGSKFSDSLAANGVPGAAIAVLHGNEIFDAAAGVLSTATNVEATPDSIFQVGSIAKLWTATLVMQLVDDGLLDLDKPVQAILPEFRVAATEASARITPRHLLSHQAGFDGDIFTDTGKGDDAIAKFVESIYDLGQLFEPGERFSYNNVGYCVLGRIVEVLLDTTWRQAVLDRISGPLGLTHVAPSADEAILHRAAVGHIGVGPEGIEIPAPIWALARSNEPAGSMLTMRARDLVAFAQMHIADGLTEGGDRVLSVESARAMRQAEVHLPPLSGTGAAWGLGWSLITTDSPMIIGHDGGTIGQSAYLRVCPELGVVIALLTNGGNATGLFNEIVEPLFQQLTGAELPGAPVPTGTPPEVDVTPFVGSYSDRLVNLTISQDADGRLWLDREPKDVLLAMGDSPSRLELAPFGPVSLIQVEPQRGTHTIYSFVGGDSIRSRFIHYSRAVPRVPES